MSSDYIPVRDSDESAQFLGHGHGHGHGSRKKNSRARRYTAILVATNVASLLVGAVTGFAASVTTAAKNADLDRVCAAHTSRYSPVLRDVDLAYRDVVFNGSFLHESVYRRPAAPDVDRAWEALGVDYRAGVIAAADAPRSGLSPGHVQRADRYGGGFLVNVEGMHHLHCLNLVRQALYYNYPYYKAQGAHAFSNSADVLQLHVSHCVDTLRQVLMCHVDTGVLGQVHYWAGAAAGKDGEGAVAAFPDFHTTHRCKDYDAVRAWAERLQAPPVDQLPPDYIKPADPQYIRSSTP